jgi:DNA adenine methylase
MTNAAIAAPQIVNAKPFIKMLGGKRKLAPTIAAIAPKRFGRYFEPFVGGGAVFFHLFNNGYLAPKNGAVLSDSNEKLVTTWRAVRDKPDSVIKHLKTLSNTKKCYDLVRARNFNEGSPAERAAEFIFCNRVGFNGVYRVNKSGQFNVPFWKYKNPTICDENNLRTASAALSGVKITKGDFSWVLGDAVKGDFCYLDPPYAPLSKTSDFTSYTKDGFTNEDQARLRDSVLELKGRGVHVVLTNSNAPLIYDLYTSKLGFKIREVRMPRAVNSKTDSRGDVTELLIT